MILEELKESEHRAARRPDLKQEIWELCMALWRDLPGLNRASEDLQERLADLRKDRRAFIREMTVNLDHFQKHYADKKKDFTATQMLENNSFHVLWEWRKKSPAGQRGITDMRESQARDAQDIPDKKVKYIVEIIGEDVNEMATVANFASLIVLLNGIMEHFGTNPKKYRGYKEALHLLHTKGEAGFRMDIWKHLIVVKVNGEKDYSHRDRQPVPYQPSNRSLYERGFRN